MENNMSKTIYLQKEQQQQKQNPWKPSDTNVVNLLAQHHLNKIVSWIECIQQ